MKYVTSNKNQYRGFPKRMVISTIISIAIVIFIFTFSRTAHAGLISFVNSLFGSEQASARIGDNVGNTLNSQTIALLAPAVNHEPNPEKSTEIVPIDDGKALVADLASQNVASLDNYSTQISTYVVRNGDTISGVAKMFDVSVSTVLWANNLTSKSVLKAGQTLVILPISGVNYTVKKGDTLRGIANKYDADIIDVLNYNDLTISSPIVVGQNLIIPYAEPLAGDKVLPSVSSGSTKLAKAPDKYYLRPISSGRVSQKLHGHNAIDFASPVGTAIMASASGTIIIDRMNGAYNGGYGNYVVISHPNGTQTLYAHMSKSTVSAGQVVSQGEVIGYIGMTGRTTGPHLHFEIRGAQNPF